MIMKHFKHLFFLMLFFSVTFFLNAQNNPSPFIGTNHPRGENLLVLRLAVSCNGEYTTQVGGVANAAANIDNWLIAMNEIYGREHCIRFELIPNNNTLIFPDAENDPWPTLPEGSGGCTNAGLILDIQGDVIDGIIGAANYDFSHVMAGAPFGGGCAGSYKGGLSGQLSFAVTRHEMGHQFQQPHTISNGGNNNYELAGGNWSIMGGNGQPYVHASSFHQTVNHITTTEAGVGTNIPTGNTVPTVNAGPDVAIPISTPYVLTGSASDPDAGDMLTYVWDSMDRGIDQGSPVTDDTQGALFMRLIPTTNPSRTIPTIEDVIHNNYNTATENLPSQPREMNIRLTVNDNHKINYNGEMVNASGSLSDDIKITVVNNGGPFQVTSPNTAVTYDGGTMQTITWDVNGTDLAPINTTNVKISLSTDGGFNFPIVLANSTANDGTEVLTLPNINTTQARVKIEAIDNIYFDMSNTDFTINQNAGIAGVNVVVTGANTIVNETGQTDTYDISLLTVPSGLVEITLTTTNQAEISLDGTNFSSTQTINFNDQSPQTITVRGVFDTSQEGSHTSVISHEVTATGDPIDYPVGMIGEPIVVNISDAQIPPVVGIDFDETVSTNSPTNWVKIDDASNASVMNIPLDDGTPTNINLTTTATLCGIGGCGFNSGNFTTPQHIQALTDLKGVVYTRGTVTFTWSNLNANTPYRVFLFGLGVFGTMDQNVSIAGDGTPITFTQAASAGTMYVNDQPTSSDLLIDFGKVVTASSTGTIVLTITSNKENDEMSFAGLAIQAVGSPAGCAASDLALSAPQNVSADYETSGSITSTQVISGAGVVVDYDALSSITLNPNFEVQLGVDFHAFIDGCGNAFHNEESSVKSPTKDFIALNAIKAHHNNEWTCCSHHADSAIPFEDYNCGIFPLSETISEMEVPTIQVVDSPLSIYPNPSRETIYVDYSLQQPQSVTLYLMDFSGRIVKVINRTHLTQGDYQERIDFKNSFSPGLYQVVLQTEENRWVEKVSYQR